MKIVLMIEVLIRQTINVDLDGEENKESGSEVVHKVLGDD